MAPVRAFHRFMRCTGVCRHPPFPRADLRCACSGASAMHASGSSDPAASQRRCPPRRTPRAAICGSRGPCVPNPADVRPLLGPLLSLQRKLRGGAAGTRAGILDGRSWRSAAATAASQVRAPRLVRPSRRPCMLRAPELADGPRGPLQRLRPRAPPRRTSAARWSTSETSAFRRILIRARRR